MTARLATGALLPMLVAVGFACAADPELTQVVVLVGGDPAVTALDTSVYDVSGARLSSSRRIDLKQRAPHRLPTSFVLVPGHAGGSARFRLVIQGIAADASGTERELARLDLLAAFAQERTTLLPLVLDAACAAEPCGCTRGRACEFTCASAPAGGARCQATPSYEALPEVVPGSELVQLADGLGRCPRGQMPAANGECNDLDECAFHLDACSLEPRACVNAAPDGERYVCACPGGYSGTGHADDPCVPCEGGPCR